MKLAVVSHVLPPMWSGQAVILYRLFEKIDPNEYCLISRANYTEPAEGGYMRRLPANFHRLPPEFTIKRGHRFGLGTAREYINAATAVVSRARRIARIVKREQCSAVLACSGDPLDPPAAYIASKLAGVPFFVYYFDYYAFQFTSREHRRIASFWERFVTRGARSVIVPNETLAQELSRRYGVAPHIVRNACDTSLYQPPCNRQPLAGEKEIRIVYTGAVYQAHYDAFRNLIAAIEILGRPGVRLHFYTAQSAAELTRNGISGPVVVHEHLSTSAMPEIQQAADILFLPLAFDSPYPDIIKTSAPGKVGEYLSSGRPILVHAPTDSFLSWYFRHHDCGVVVDRSDPTELATALKRLLVDSELRCRISQNAWHQANEDFSLENARTTFRKILGLRR